MEQLTDKQIENRKIWIEALRSGKYVQGNSYLKSEIDGVIEHCCLGVAIETLGIGFEPDYAVSNVQDSKGRLNKSCFPVRKNSLGEYSETRCLDINTKIALGIEAQNYLIEANDVHGKSFDEIANIIEKDTTGEENTLRPQWINLVD